MRTLHELYLVLWDKIKDEICLPFGLCHELEILFGNNHSEFQKIADSLHENTPMELSKYSWPLTKKGTLQRKEFVLAMLEKTKPNFHYTGQIAENAPQEVKEALNEMAKKAFESK